MPTWYPQAIFHQVCPQSKIQCTAEGFKVCLFRLEVCSVVSFDWDLRMGLRMIHSGLKASVHLNRISEDLHPYLHLLHFGIFCIT